MKAIICGPAVYKFAGVTFEVSYHGPNPLNKNSDPVDEIPQSFWRVWKAFNKCDDKERYKLAPGGCFQTGGE